MKKLLAMVLLVCLILLPMMQQSVYAEDAAKAKEDIQLKISAVSSCLNNTAVLAVDGTVWAWGDNSYGQLGAGADIKFSFKPMRIEGFDGASAVAVGNGYILALKGDGTVWGIGSNTVGQISDAKASDKILEPTQVPKLSGIKAISAGTNYALALNTDGNIFVLGSYINRSGSIRKRAPELLSNFSNAERVIALRYNAVAIKIDSTAWAFRGDRIKADEITNITGIVSVAEGVKRTFAVDAAGNVWYWGINGQGADKLEGVSGMKELCDAGGYKTMALDNKGNVWVWDNEKLIPQKMTGIEQAIAISAGDRHMAVLQQNGLLYSWGENNIGQLGNGVGAFEVEPLTVPGVDNVKEVSASDNYTLVLKNDGTVWAWGDNSNGQLGIGTKIESLIPQKVEGLENIIAVSAGISHAVALKQDGTLWAWGINGAGELGNGTYENTLLPVQVKGIDQVTAVSAGGDFTVALKSNRSLWVWGNSGYVRKTDLASIDRSIPRRVEEIDNVKSFAAGRDFIIALKNNDSLWGWGSNNYGQLDGRADKENKAVEIPLAISGIGTIKQISTGSSFTLALRSDRRLYAWGSNDFGQLGLDSKKTGTSKYIIKDFEDVSVVSTGENHSYAIKKDGSLWAWGDNSYGQLGIMKLGIVEYPVQVEGIKGFKHIFTGSNHTIAVMADGTIRVWGDNSYGQLGIGKRGITRSDIPLQIQLTK